MLRNTHNIVRYDMSILDDMKNEMKNRPAGAFLPDIFRSAGYMNVQDLSDPAARAEGIAALFGLPEPFIYKNDLIAGSIRDVFCEADEEEKQKAARLTAKYPERGFCRNGDHFAADYFTATELGIPGLLQRIED